MWIHCLELKFQSINKIFKWNKLKEIAQQKFRFCCAYKGNRPKCGGRCPMCPTVCQNKEEVWHSPLANHLNIYTKRSLPQHRAKGITSGTCTRNKTYKPLKNSRRKYRSINILKMGNVFSRMLRQILQRKRLIWLYKKYMYVIHTQWLFTLKKYIEKPRKIHTIFLFLCTWIFYFMIWVTFEILKKGKAKARVMNSLPRFPPQEQVHEFILHWCSCVLFLDKMDNHDMHFLNDNHIYSKLQEHDSLPFP